MNKKILIGIIVIILILIAFLEVASVTNIKEDSDSNFANISENNQELSVSNESENSTTGNNIKSYYLEDNVSVPVSNSNAPAGEIVWKSFNITSNEPQIDLSAWESSNSSNLYYKKITEYSKYKELMDNYSNIRELTESDFENYFVVIIISEDTDKTLKFKYTEIDNTQSNEDSQTMKLIINCEEIEESQNTQYSALAVIMTNWHTDFILDIQTND